MNVSKASLLLFLIMLSPLLTAQQSNTGKTLYEQSCLVCHGEDGTGAMPGVADFTGAKGPLNQRDEQLAKSIRDGIQSKGAVMAMPPKGGNPQLSDKDIENIIKHMRKTFK